MCSCSLFFTAAHFHLALVPASISHFVTAATKFSCCSSTKKMSPLFFFLVELHWPAVFLLLYIPNLWTSQFIYLSLILFLDNLGTETISAFIFSDSLVVSALQDMGGYTISCQNNLELHLPYLLIGLFNIGMPVMQTDSQSRGRCMVM